MDRTSLIHTGYQLVDIDVRSLRWLIATLAPGGGQEAFDRALDRFCGVLLGPLGRIVNPPPLGRIVLLPDGRVTGWKKPLFRVEVGTVFAAPNWVVGSRIDVPIADNRFIDIKPSLRMESQPMKIPKPEFRVQELQGKLVCDDIGTEILVYAAPDTPDATIERVANAFEELRRIDAFPGPGALRQRARRRSADRYRIQLPEDQVQPSRAARPRA